MRLIDRLIPAAGKSVRIDILHSRSNAVSLHSRCYAPQSIHQNGSFTGEHDPRSRSLMIYSTSVLHGTCKRSALYLHPYGCVYLCSFPGVDRCCVIRHPTCLDIRLPLRSTERNPILPASTAPIAAAPSSVTCSNPWLQ